MSVAYLVDRYPVRTQTFIRLEVEELRRQGVDVGVWALRAGSEPDGDVVVLRTLAMPRSRATAAHARAIISSPRRYARFLRMARALRSERSELMARRLPAIARMVQASGATRLHAHFAWSGAAIAACISELTGLPWSMTVHGNDVFGATRNLPHKLRSATQVVAVCEYMRSYLADNHGVDAELVVCGVDPPADWVRPNADADIVFAGRLVEKKGLDVLLEAVDPAWTVDIVGEGPLRDSMEAIVRARGLPRVRFLGALSHRDTLDRIARGRVFCLPARIAPDGDRDSMPVVIKEAMARAVPVVATDTVGIPEMVDRTTGWLVPVDDAAALRGALAEALADPTEAAARGLAGRERVIERFTLGAEVSKLRRGVLAA